MTRQEAAAYLKEKGVNMVWVATLPDSHVIELAQGVRKLLASRGKA
jgi:hypothetical protein